MLKIKRAFYLRSVDGLFIEFPEGDVYRANYDIKEIKEEDLKPFPGLMGRCDPSYSGVKEISPYMYPLYGLEKITEEKQ